MGAFGYFCFDLYYSVFSAIFCAFSVLAKCNFAYLANKSRPPSFKSLAATWSDLLPAPEGRV